LVDLGILEILQLEKRMMMRMSDAEEDVVIGHVACGAKSSTAEVTELAMTSQPAPLLAVVVPCAL
jgi:hypothetical protein